MKTTVSLPDPLFRRADSAARRMHMSRSELFATALAEYLDGRDDNRVTERLNQVYENQDSSVDPAFRGAMSHVLRREDW
jgi:metal-responsive CopG/Arc/MetJ family transcriptional regulator